MNRALKIALILGYNFVACLSLCLDLLENVKKKDISNPELAVNVRMLNGRALKRYNPVSICRPPHG